MVSSKRRKQAKREGKRAYSATNGNPHLTKNPYNRNTAQWRAFNEGWNNAKSNFKFLQRL